MLNKSLMVAAIVALAPAFAMAQGAADKPVANPAVTTEGAAATTHAKADAATKAVTHKVKKTKKAEKPVNAVPAETKTDTHS